MFQEHDRVVLTVDFPQHQLKAGAVGIVVHLYSDNQAYEVEFFALDGHTLNVVTIEADQVRSVTR